MLAGNSLKMYVGAGFEISSTLVFRIHLDFRSLPWSSRWWCLVIGRSLFALFLMCGNSLLGPLFLAIITLRCNTYIYLGGVKI